MKSCLLLSSTHLKAQSDGGRSPGRFLVLISLAAISLLTTLSGQAVAETNRQELDEILQRLEQAGRQEVSLNAPSADALEGFSERLQQALELNGCAGEGTHDGALSVEDHKMLDLLLNARSYSEAKLLAQVTFGRLGEVPAVPKELSKDPQDPDWQFAGYSPQIPAVIEEALQARRSGRDKVLDSLEDSDFEAYAKHEESIFEVQEEEAARVRGLKFDSRPDLYALVTRDGLMWLRKEPIGYQPMKDPHDPNGPWLADQDLLDRDFADQDLLDRDFADQDFIDRDAQSPEVVAKAIVGGADNRALRSAWNGFDMGSANWAPMGALIPGSTSPNAQPPDVECSGIKIGRRLVATAGHCIYRWGSNTNYTRWIPGADGVAVAMGGSNDPSPNGARWALARIVRGPWFHHGWGRFDFGLFILYNNPGVCAEPWYNWATLSVANRGVFLFGYPKVSRNCAASPLANDNCHGSLYGHGGTVSFAGTYRARYSIDTQEGQDGAGFFRFLNGRRWVVGVHTGNWSGSLNQGVRINNGNGNMIINAIFDYPATACN